MQDHSIPFLLLLLATSTSLSAQSFVSSPTGQLSVEAEAGGSMLGAHSAARIMLFDGELRGRAATIREVSVRDDFRPYTSAEGMGRSWSNVTIDVAECDFAKASPVFSQNWLTTPTRVFSASVTWPTNTGIPSTLPAAWSKQFPFSSNWAYGGANSIALDFDFSGGAMANGAGWTTATIHSYYLDAPATAKSVEGQQFFYGQSTFGCIDSSASQGATNFLSCTAYAPNFHVPAYRGKYRLHTFSYFTAPGQPVINVVNFVGIQAGVAFQGITCNPLYLDLTKFLLIDVSTAKNAPGAWSGYVYPTKTPDGLFNSNPAFAGIPLWAQAMWNDSKTGELKLSRAVNTAIPPVPRAVERSAIYQWDTSRKRVEGLGPYDTPDFNPLLRYRL